MQPVTTCEFDAVRLLRPALAATLLDVSRRRIYQLVAGNHLRAVRLTGRGSLRIPLTAIRELQEKEREVYGKLK